MFKDNRTSSKKGIHIGIIPDGNRRFARRGNRDVWEGHLQGAKKTEEFLDWCTEYPEIKRVSIYALSTENLKRSKEELDDLWKIYTEQLRKVSTDPLIKEKGIQIRVLGDTALWRPDLKDVAKEVVKSTKHYSKYILNIMLAYGSKLEINNAVKKVVGKPLYSVDKFLMVKEPLDLVIRTGGQHRLSNFMLYQASYAELYFTDTLWPEFTKKEFDKIMRWYRDQEKKFGR